MDPLSVPSVEAFLALELRVSELEHRIAPQGASASPYMTVFEAAEYLRCKRQRVDDLLSEGRLTRIKEGSRTLVSRAKLERHLGA